MTCSTPAWNTRLHSSRSSPPRAVRICFMWRDGRVLRVLFLGIETAGTQAVAIAVNLHGQGKRWRRWRSMVCSQQPHHGKSQFVTT